MKILLTGRPGVGKSTVLEKIKKDHIGTLGGVLTKEIRNTEHERVGFEASNMNGESKVLAHKVQFQGSPLQIGSFNVNLECFTTLILPALSEGLRKELLLIDEIGRMQALSEEFLITIRQAFASDINILGTIVFDPEPWSLEFKKNPSVILVDVTKENRDILPDILQLIFQTEVHFLKTAQKEFLTSLLRVYLQTNAFIQIKKLFKNALPYLEHNKIIATGDSHSVKGNHHLHHVAGKDTYTCDCDLFNGRGIYDKNAGECSHIQAVKLFTIE